MPGQRCIAMKPTTALAGTLATAAVDLRSRWSPKLCQLVDTVEAQAGTLQESVLRSYNEAKLQFEKEMPGHDFNLVLQCQTRDLINFTRERYDRVGAKLRQIQRSSWALDQTALSHHFGSEVLGSLRFLNGLLEFSHLAVFPVARQLICAARDARRSREDSVKGIDPTRNWTPRDVEFALAEYKRCVVLQPRSQRQKRQRADADDYDGSEKRARPLAPRPSLEPAISQVQPHAGNAVDTSGIEETLDDVDVSMSIVSVEDARHMHDAPTESDADDEGDNVLADFALRSPPHSHDNPNMNDIRAIPRPPTPIPRIGHERKGSKTLGASVMRPKTLGSPRPASAQLDPPSPGSPPINDVQPPTGMLPAIGACPEQRRVRSPSEPSVKDRSTHSSNAMDRADASLITPPPTSHVTSIVGDESSEDKGRIEPVILPPSNDVEGALDSLREGCWLSSTAIELVLALFVSARSHVRVVDPSYISVADPLSVSRKPPLSVDDRKTLIVVPLLDRHHWTVAFLHLETGIIDHFDSLSMEPSRIETALLTFGQRLSHAHPRLASLTWRFRSQVEYILTH